MPSGGRRGFVFQLGFDRSNPVAVDVDFLEEIDNPATARFAIGDILYIARDSEPDLAFLRLNPGKGPLARPIKLASKLLPSKTMVGVVGYPGRDPRIPDQDLMAKIFGNVFDKKRFAPGLVIGFEADALTHDCTTLGGNSGSAVLDLLTGEAAALHFSGVFLKTNYAVPAPVISELLARVKQAAAITASSSPELAARHDDFDRCGQIESDRGSNDKHDDCRSIADHYFVRKSGGQYGGYQPVRCDCEYHQGLRSWRATDAFARCVDCRHGRGATDFVEIVPT